MKNRFVDLKHGMAVALAAVLALAPLPAAMPESAAEAADITLKNPRIVVDNSMEAKQKVSWDCVYFGSYPQAEVISSGMEYTALDAKLRRDGDVIVSDNVYSALQSASGWDDNNDITLNGVKYRRMKQEDATYNAGSSGLSTYYQWDYNMGYHYFKYEPIKWRVLRTDGKQALLLSDVVLDTQKYHTAHEDVTWETSTVRSWLNGYGADSNKQSEDYSQKNFIESAFSSLEQEAIVSLLLENADNIEHGISGGNNTTDKIFLLSESDVWNTDTAKFYGFVKDMYTFDEARLQKSSVYARAMGGYANTLSNFYAENVKWWLRSPGYWSSNVMDVSSYGQVNGRSQDIYVYHYGNGICPALNLNLSCSNLYTYAGTVCSDGTNVEVGGSTVTPGGETPEPELPGGEILSNPRIVPDDSMEAIQKVTWDCVWFGSYPQAEVIPSGIEYMELLDERLWRDGGVIVSDSVYAAIQSASGWDINNNITLNGAKYHRMKKEDATCISSISGYHGYQWSNSTDYHYFKYEPIKWRVLHTDGKQALLQSDVVLDLQKYHTANESVTWETSTVRSWLNGYGAGSNQQSTDYSRKNFIDNAFTDSEQEAVVDSLLENLDSLEGWAEGGNNTTDKIFLLSESEVWNTEAAKSYGFVKARGIQDEGRFRKSSVYAQAMGISSVTIDNYIGNCNWWLRSPGQISEFAMSVYHDGSVVWRGDAVDNDRNGICPALNLNLSSSNLYSYAGTVCSDEIKNIDTGISPQPENPNKKPLLEQKPTKVPPVGSRLTDKSKKAVYKVTGKDKVEYSKISNKKNVSVKIPDKVTLNGKAYKVTSIGKGAFQNCKKLKSVVVGKNVTSIGAKAFSGCKALKKITIKSAKLKKVGKIACKGIHAKAVIKTPKAKLKAYKKLMKKKGQGKKVRITK